jgi:hypothetical protein
MRPDFSLSTVIIFVKKHDTRLGVSTFARVTIDGVAWKSSTERRKTCLTFDYSVEKLRILRQPLKDIHTSAAESCGFTVSFTSDAIVSCANYQRPFDNSYAKLRSWQQIQKTCNGSLNCSFSANPKIATGVHGYLLLTLMDDVQILICLGLSCDFQPLCIILPFCKQILNKGLECEKILREYDRISRHQEDFLELFDTEIHMICLCGDDQTLEVNTDIGLSLEI